jgi:phosphopantothenoylcysteine decarboxylase/phosphopantothenate--cysteine ligase
MAGMESDKSRALAVGKLFAAGTVDAVIHNDMDDLATGDVRPFHAWTAGQNQGESVAGIEALAAWLQAFLAG